jgi:hypothetical protein
MRPDLVHRDGMLGNRTAVRRVLDQDDREHRRQHAEAGRRQIGGAPAAPPSSATNGTADST